MSVEPSPAELRKLETILATLDDVTQLATIDEITRRMARAFVELGAVMSIIYVRQGDELRVAARWPESAADALFEQGGGAGGRVRRLVDYAIPLSSADNMYAQVHRTQQPLFLDGPEQVADHIIAAYQGDASKRDLVVAALHGRAGAVLPLVAGRESLGIAGINYADDLQDADLRLFNIFASSAATLLNFKRDVVSKEAILADLAQALENERHTRAELNRAERLAALGEMSAVVAHEIRNPLGVISNSITSLARHLDSSAEAELLVEIIREETRRINRIIGEMLTFSSPMQERGQWVDPGELLSRAVEQSSRDYAETPHPEITERRASDLPSIVVDPHLITQAVVNLLSNAFEATQRGGQVAVETEAVELDGKTFVRFVVRDAGVGMSPEQLEQIYQPFFTTKASGTGLGLSIVKRIVDIHDGRIDIQSEPGRGTQVTIDLPAAIKTPS